MGRSHGPLRPLYIGLYNSYDPRRFTEAHRRVIARAAALCAAYGYHLTLFGFPLPTGISSPESLLDSAFSGSSIGGWGEVVGSLAGRVHISPYPKRGISPQFGRCVLATCHAKDHAPISVREVVDILRTEPLTVIFGTGPRGVPRTVFHLARHHLDITGCGVSLETCTALGAVASGIHWVSKLTSAPAGKVSEVR